MGVSTGPGATALTRILGQFYRQQPRDVVDGRLGCAVGQPHAAGHQAGHRRDEHHRRAGRHERLQRQRELDRAFDIGVHHLVPRAQLALGCGDVQHPGAMNHAAHAAGMAAAHGMQGLGHGVRAAHVADQWHHPAGWRQPGHALQFVQPAAECQHGPAAGGHAQSAGLAQPRAGAGDHHSGHGPGALVAVACRRRVPLCGGLVGGVGRLPGDHGRANVAVAHGAPAPDLRHLPLGHHAARATGTPPVWPLNEGTQ